MDDFAKINATIARGMDAEWNENGVARGYNAALRCAVRSLVGIVAGQAEALAELRADVDGQSTDLDTLYDAIIDAAAPAEVADVDPFDEFRSWLAYKVDSEAGFAGYEAYNNVLAAFDRLFT